MQFGDQKRAKLSDIRGQSCTVLAFTFAPPDALRRIIPIYQGGGVTTWGSVFIHFYLPRVTLKGNIVQGKNNLYSGAALFLFERIGRLVE